MAFNNSKKRSCIWEEQMDEAQTKFSSNFSHKYLLTQENSKRIYRNQNKQNNIPKTKNGFRNIDGIIFSNSLRRRRYAGNKNLIKN